jgi:predicted DNA-binding transcriptional regulator AlpA
MVWRKPVARCILRPAEAMRRLGIKRTTFYGSFVASGRLRLVHIGARARGVIEDELNQLIDDLAAARDQDA